MGVVRALRDSSSSEGAQAPSIPSDPSLIEAACSGQNWAFEALFHRYVRMAHGLARRLLGGTSIDVEDVVQDAFIAAYNRLGTLRAPEAFAGWLGSIVIRLCAKRLRRHQLLVRFGLARPEAFDFDLQVSADAPPDVAVELRQIYALLDRLRPDERIALLLRRVEALTVAEIAERTNASVSTVKRRLQFAEERLERALSAKPMPHAMASSIPAPPTAPSKEQR